MKRLFYERAKIIFSENMSVTSQKNLASSMTLGEAKGSVPGGKANSQSGGGDVPAGEPKAASSAAKPDNFQQFGNKKA